MKKIVVLLMLGILALSTLLFAGCGKKTNNDSQKSTKEKVEEVKPLTIDDFKNCLTKVELTADNWENYFSVGEYDASLSVFGNSRQGTLFGALSHDCIVDFTDENRPEMHVSYDYNITMSSASGIEVSPFRPQSGTVDDFYLLSTGDSTFEEVDTVEIDSFNSDTFYTKTAISNFLVKGAEGNILTYNFPEKQWKNDGSGKYIEVEIQDRVYKMYENGALFNPEGEQLNTVYTQKPFDSAVDYMYSNIVIATQLP